MAVGAPSSLSVREEPPDTVLTPQFSQNIDFSIRELSKAASEMAAGSPPSRSVRQGPPDTVALPLVLQDIDLSAEPKLNSEQIQAINGLRQNFIEEVGGTNQDPNDPAYSQRWQESQPQADLDLRGMIGINAWEGYQIGAWAKAHEQTPSGP